MKLFACPNCRNRIYFENSRCLSCGSSVTYDPDAADFLLAGASGSVPCANAHECACNWRAADGAAFCRACGLNKIIPNLSVAGNRQRWTRVEFAKKRAIYSLLAFGLPVESKGSDRDGLAFDLVAEDAGGGPGGERILTGHDNGLITLNVAEADSARREKMRLEMGEAYRTVLGHFRHELGHYYWNRLIRDHPERLRGFRDCFSDERADYASALERHYANGPPPDWQSTHISAYATSHPWEDWAESWAHYIHITDTLEMAHALDIPLGRLAPADKGLLARDDTAQGSMPSPAEGGWSPEPFERIMERWLVLSETSNSINRCMGLPDLYPFVISPPATAKLAFVHDLLAEPGGHG